MTITTADRIAFAEVDEILKILDESLVNKIPESVRRVYTNNRDVEYKVDLDMNKSIKEQKISRKAIVYLSELHLKYWCSDDERKELLDIFAENEEKLKKELEKQYDLEYVLKKKKEEKLENVPEENKNLEMSICNYEKKNFFQKIMDKIKQMFKK